MTLSCDCDYEPEMGALVCCVPDDFEELKTARRRRCVSCKTLIDLGALVLKFKVTQIPEHEIEIKIYGEDGEIPRADKYLCEKCGEIYLNLEALGFTAGMWIKQDMRELLREYHELYDPQKLKSKENFKNGTN